MTNAETKRYNSIDVFRLVCAILIVAIHTGPFSDFSPLLGWLVSGVLARFAVPFFFAVSGYFLYDKLQKQGPAAVWGYLKKIVFIYTVWSVPYLLLELAAHYSEEPILSILGRFIPNYLLFGSRFHFWYFPALIISSLFLTLLFVIFSKKSLPLIPVSVVLFIIGCLMSCYVFLGNSIPLISNLNSMEKGYVIRRIFFTGLSFVTLGAIIKAYSQKLLSMKKRSGSLLLYVLSVVYIVEMFVIRFTTGIEEVQCFTLFPLVAVILVVLLQHPLKTHNDQGYTCRLIANFTYYTHPLFIFAVQKISAAVGHGIESGTLLFLIVTFFCVAIGFVLKNTPLRKLIG